eukprot:14040188-Heterocapsa_arctica.AAC.1
MQTGPSSPRTGLGRPALLLRAEQWLELPRPRPLTSGTKPTEEATIHRHAEAAPSASKGAVPPTASGAAPQE